MTGTVTALVCGECGGGNYTRRTWAAKVYHCTVCDHSITAVDVVLDEGESLGFGPDGLLAVTTVEG